MKNHAIGDGNKRISCPDQYLAEEESDSTIVIWDPAHAGIPIRVTILTIVPQDPRELEAAYWGVIQQAQKSGVQPKILKNKAVHFHRQPANAEGYCLHFFRAGMGNHHCIFSVTATVADEGSSAFKQVQSDLEQMIESLVERKEGEQFDCELQECEKKRIETASHELLRGQRGSHAWKLLEEHYKEALRGNNAELGGQIGFAFGELLREEVPSFHWMVKIDEYGRSRSLDFENAKISIFPEDMVLKRIDRQEKIDFEHLSSGTIDLVENLYRKHQGETQG